MQILKQKNFMNKKKSLIDILKKSSYMRTKLKSTILWISCMEAVGVEPTSENISTRLSPSADHIFLFALTAAYGQVAISAIFNCSASGRRTPDTVPCFR